MMMTQQLMISEDLFALKQKELDLVLAIDRIRDTVPEPLAMLDAIADLLVTRLPADLCGIALREQDSDQMKLKALSQRRQVPLPFSRELAERAVQLAGITVWTRGAPELKDWPANSSLLTMPIMSGEAKNLGALLLARTGGGFRSEEVDLLRTVENMIDSAILQGYAHVELQRRLKELETIYRIDHIRDQDISFDEMLNAILSEVCQAIEAEAGFTMLYDQAGQRLELRATTNQDLFQVTARAVAVEQLSDQALHEARLICRNGLDNGLQSLMCLPLILKDQMIGVLGVINSRRQTGFDAEDQRLLVAIGSQIDTAIFESIERRRLRQVLGRSVDPRVMERLLASPDVSFLKGERMRVSVLYADIRGSTRLAEKTDPELLVGFINSYLGQMTEVILAHEGTLDKFVGDEVMALFGAPFPQPDHALRAVRVALEMQAAYQKVLERWQDRLPEPAPIGIGIATGDLIVGEMGSAQRTDFTVLGQAANLGARLCSAAKGGEVLICEETYTLAQHHVIVAPMNGLQFKGIEREMMVYRVESLVSD